MTTSYSFYAWVRAVGRRQAAPLAGLLLAGTTALLAPAARAQTIISAANTVVNKYGALSADAAMGVTTIRLPNAAAADFAATDQILLVQMQGATINQTDNATYGNVTDYGSAGRYEVRTINSVNNVTGGPQANRGFFLNLNAPTTNAYTTAGGGQVVRMPTYATGLTITSPGSIVPAPWNGTTGGVVALNVTGNLIVNTGASIDASGRGFRGGSVVGDNASQSDATIVTLYRSTAAADGGEKGESIAGYQAGYGSGRYGRGAPANGGGGGNSHNAGGGGGSNVGGGPYTGTGNPARGTANAYDAAWNLEAANFATSTSSGGGRGGYTFSDANQNPLTVGPNNTAWNATTPTVAGNSRTNVGGQGGRPLLAGTVYAATRRLFLGGGGGAGDANNNNSLDGGDGGGLVFVLATGTVSGAGSILANGGAGGASGANPNTTGDAAGGGGGGGSIVLNSQGALSGLTLSAVGGVGGSQTTYPGDPNEGEGPGGGGGGGYIGYTTGTPGSASVAGGANGITDVAPFATAFPPNGATRGSVGLVQRFTATTGNVPLPVELVSFTATAEGPAAVGLAWATASEKNSAFFDVERSIDGTHFVRLGTVTAAGGSSSARAYDFVDSKRPGAARLYYRLKQVDLDGSFSYSPVRSVSLPAGAEAGLALFPNPALGGAATLTGAAPGTVVTVFDALGRPVKSATADAVGTAALALPAGVYVVRSGARAVRLVVE